MYTERVVEMKFRGLLRLPKILAIEFPRRLSSSTMPIVLDCGRAQSLQWGRAVGQGARLVSDSPETSLHPTLEHHIQPKRFLQSAQF